MVCCVVHRSLKSLQYNLVDCMYSVVACIVHCFLKTIQCNLDGWWTIQYGLMYCTLLSEVYIV
jgi:hypothetical protein